MSGVPQCPHKNVLFHNLTIFLVILGSTLVTLGQVFIVIEGFLDQMSKVKWFSNVLRNTFWCKPGKIFHIFQYHDARVPCHIHMVNEWPLLQLTENFDQSQRCRWNKKNCKIGFKTNSFGLWIQFYHKICSVFISLILKIYETLIITLR